MEMRGSQELCRYSAVHMTAATDGRTCDRSRPSGFLLGTYCSYPLDTFRVIWRLKVCIPFIGVDILSRLVYLGSRVEWTVRHNSSDLLSYHLYVLPVLTKEINQTSADNLSLTRGLNEILHGSHQFSYSANYVSVFVVIFGKN